MVFEVDKSLLKEKMKSFIENSIINIETKIALYNEHKVLLAMLKDKGLIYAYPTNEDDIIEKAYKNFERDFYNSFYIKVNSKEILNMNMINVNLIDLLDIGINNISSLVKDGEILINNDELYKIDIVKILFNYFNVDVKSDELSFVMEENNPFTKVSIKEVID